MCAMDAGRAMGPGIDVLEIGPRIGTSVGSQQERSRLLSRESHAASFSTTSSCKKFSLLRAVRSLSISSTITGCRRIWWLSDQMFRMTPWREIYKGEVSMTWWRVGV